MNRYDRPLIAQYVDKWANKRSDSEALVFGDQRLTWAQVACQVDAIAKAMLEAGVRKGDRVAFLAMARNEFLTSFMAAARVGAVWVGISPKSTTEEVLYVLQDCQPSVLISLREYGGKDFADTLSLAGVRETLANIPHVWAIGEPTKEAEDFHELVSRPREHLDNALRTRAADVRPQEPVLLIYTSGSTGKPKGVLHTHESILASVAVQADKFRFHENGRSLLHFPINHVAADVEIGFATLYSGGTIVFMDRFDPADSLRMISSEKITLVGQVPAMFMMQMATPQFASTDLTSVETFVWSGATAPRNMVEALGDLCQRTGATMYNGYGSTELAGFVTYSEPGDGIDVLCEAAGKAADPFELRIIGADGAELPDGETGEIAVRGELVMDGYYNRPEETARRLSEDGWYRTDDLAWKDERGYIHITGRMSEVYRSGGENISPREIEEVIESYAGVSMAAVVGVPHPVYGQVGHAFVMTAPGQSPSVDTLRAHCREFLANYKVPKQFDIRARLPLLPTGKIDKVALKVLLKSNRLDEEDGHGD